MRYYVTKQRIVQGSYPESPFREVTQVVKFDKKTYCEDIGMAAWGFVEYKNPLHPEDVKEYGLLVIPSKIKEVVFVGVDDFRHRVYKDKNGMLWKYTEPGEMPEERHDVLHASSGNDIDGEPGWPMASDFDYRIKERFSD